MINFNKSITACFSGYRPEKLKYNTLTKDDIRALEEKILKKLILAYENGYRNFLAGGAQGFDTICSEQVIKLSDAHDIRLFLALPFKSFNYGKSEWNIRAERVKQTANVIYYAFDNYNICSFQARNEYMIDNSSLLICYHTGIRGGTLNTINYARSKNIEIINIAML